MSVLNEVNNQTIFISALNWGSGHLSRTAAIIQQLKNKNNIVIFSAKNQSEFFKELFPDIPQVLFNEIAIHFNPEFFFKDIVKYTKHFFQSIENERKVLNETISKMGIQADMIISDNRYGFFSEHCKNIFITHQVEMQLPLYLSIVSKTHQFYLKKFDEIWVPDYEDENLSLAGKLSRTKNKLIQSKIQYIFPQSMMQKYEVDKDIDYLFLISGTDDERRYFDKLVKNFVEELLRKNDKLNIRVIGGLYRDNKIFEGWKNLNKTNNSLLRSKVIITRAGYSSLMDLNKITDKNQGINFIQSPQQYEQQYLYGYWINRGWAKAFKV